MVSLAPSQIAHSTGTTGPRAPAPGSDDLAWEGGGPDVGGPVLVVAPHPDDEVIAAAGILVWLEQLDIPTSIVAVTDGEASHASSHRISPDELRDLRAREREASLDRLGVTIPVERLALPDGSVRSHVARLAGALAERSGRGCVILAPWQRDLHPDHEAVARAAALAAVRTEAVLWTVPIWSKVRSPGTFESTGPRSPSRLKLSDRFRARKRAALDCHTSQLVAFGPDPADGPVLHPNEVALLLDGTEDVRWT